ncbi:hypothetical protein ACH5RR_000836, partial [Cinchona calisaya]
MLLSAITVEKTIPSRDGLLYVLAKVNRMDILVMINTGKTHSFVTGCKVRRLKLKLKEHVYHIKAINLEAQPLLSVATVELTLGPWSDNCSLMAVPLGDFNLILGKDFMATDKIFPISHLDGVMIANERCPTFIPSVFVNTNASAGPLSRRKQAKRDRLIKRKQFHKEVSKFEDQVAAHWEAQKSGGTCMDRLLAERGIFISLALVGCVVILGTSVQGVDQ